MSHVASDEDAGYARLQEVRVPVLRPVLGTLAVPYQVGPREDKASLVALDHPFEPVRLRRRPDEDKERASRDGLLFARPRVLYPKPLQVILSKGLDDAGVYTNLDLL